MKVSAFASQYPYVSCRTYEFGSTPAVIFGKVTPLRVFFEKSILLMKEQPQSLSEAKPAYVEEVSEQPP